MQGNKKVHFGHWYPTLSSINGYKQRFKQRHTQKQLRDLTCKLT